MISVRKLLEESMMKKLAFSLLIIIMILSACSSTSFSEGGIGYGTPASTVRYKIPIGNCIGSKWATLEDGLALTLSDTAGDIFFHRVTSQPRNWGDSLNGSVKPVYYETEITIPVKQPVPALYTGTLTGAILCPVGGTVHYSFTNKEVKINKAIELHIVTNGEMKQLANQRFWKKIQDIGMVIGLIIVLGIIFGLYQIIKEKLTGSRRRRYR
jgi:hypothetical protein